MGLFGNFMKAKWDNLIEMHGGYSEKELENLAYQSDHGDQAANDIIRDLFNNHGMDYKEYNRIRKNVYLPLANSGDADAQCWMGLLNMDDARKSREWYLKAAEQGNVEAMKTLARKYSEVLNQPGDEFPGFGVDPEKECYWYQKAADAGDPDAMCSLAMNYMIGDGVPEDHQKAFDLYQQAAGYHYGPAYLKLGEIYESPVDGHYDIGQAIYNYQKAAERGEANTVSSAAKQLALIYGGCYLYGYNPNQVSDASKALYWLFQCYLLEDECLDEDTKRNIVTLCQKAGLNIPSEDVQNQWRQDARCRVSG